ncbi:hypothetical protein [Fictibacillus sp. KU28468]|uniref:hypothetical protein n=1 Tax=Fictibacillus sp. KU28468 TaxID=2991053 RepID=UPI00223CF7E3|nr:hypothetical protein [Fictibacillus sp. KU28468]UZJ77068.1 hypothetical protein OKX00_12740 [Fictibacillus sp. KU28468]
MAKDNQITGIIDWTLAINGDHLYDKANFPFWNEEKLQPLIQEITNNSRNMHQMMKQKTRMQQ